MAEHSTLHETPHPVLLGLREVAALCGMSEASLKRMRRCGRFGPAPVAFSKRLVRYSRAEIEGWVAAGCPARKLWLERKGGGR